jgi:hypothetical protein
MKRVVLAVLAVALAAGLGAGQAFAQEKKVEFSLNAGGMTVYGDEFAFDQWVLTVSPQVDIHVAKGFMISPEAMFITDFTGVAVLPGVMFNYLGRGFFIGGGAVLPVSISEGLGVAELLPKINLGYRGAHFNFTVYTITSFRAFFRYGLAGAGIGYRF